MQNYQIYTIDKVGRRIGRFEFLASSDEEAQAAAQQFREGQAAELWHGRHWINAWSHPEAAPALHVVESSDGEVARKASSNRQRGAMSGWARRFQQRR